MKSWLLLLFMLPSAVLAQVPFMSCFELASRQHQISLTLLLAVASVESGFRDDARSSKGAHGVMQIRWPVTARHLGVGRVAELYNPCLNIERGAAYMKELAERYRGDTRRMLAAYNYGPGRISRTDSIPAGASAYADRVLETQIVLKAKYGSSEGKERLVLAEFTSRSIAQRYKDAISRRLSGVPVSVATGAAGYEVVLDQQDMSPGDLIRLRRLWPNVH